jgi:hypothetical protein
MITSPPSGPLPVKEGVGANVSGLTGVTQRVASIIIQAVAVALLVVMPAVPLFAMGAKQSVEQNNGPVPPPQPVRSSNGVTVKAIQQNPTHFTEKEIVLEGVFRGWTGKCVSPFITRSDWVLEDETGCIYVTGRIPASLSPFHPKGEAVLVQGRVITTKNGKPVIKAARITLLSK